MSNKYFITLTPLDWFFFGGEKTLGSGDKADYLARSNKLPQQTAVLGMLRYQLLKQKGWLKDASGVSKAKPDEIKDLIGVGSFSMQKQNVNFGKINKISPIVLYKEELFIPMPLDKGQNVSFEDAKVSLNDVKKSKLIKCDGFDHKRYKNYDKWISKQLEKVSSEIFESKMQIGITKNGGDDAFYKQGVLRLKDGFKFAFYAEIDEDLKSDIVFLGAQQSCFKMDVVPMNEDVDSMFKKNCPSVVDNNKNVERIVLLSNAYVEKMSDLHELCLFHWSNSTPFRNMEEAISEDEKQQKGLLHSGAVKYKKQAVKYNYFTAGSVLYFEKKNREKIEQLLNLNYLQTIGYNYFI